MRCFNALELVSFTGLYSRAMRTALGSITTNSYGGGDGGGKGGGGGLGGGEGGGGGGLGGGGLGGGGKGGGGDVIPVLYALDSCPR